ncbi:MAG: ABC transporter permease [Terricaulis sp.]
MGWLAAFGALVHELVGFRSHIATLFASDFTASYRGTTLGIAWNILLPMLPVSVYVLLAKLRVFPAIEGISPEVYIGFNITLWFLFTGLINHPIHVVRSRGTGAMKTAIPLSATIAASFARLCFDTLVRVVLVALLMIATSTMPTIGTLAFVPAAFAGLVFFLGLGLALSILNVVYPDIERVITITLQYGIFVSGVIFPIASMGPLAMLETLNPFNVFIQAARDLVFFGALTHPAAFFAWTIGGVLLLLFAARLFHLTEYRIRGLAE